MDALSLQAATKYYGDTRALGPVSFEIPQGSTVGFLGLNGVGKTTLLRILACDLRPTAGVARVAGVDVLATANNHAVDNFKTGITRTISVLDKMGMAQLGTYSSAEDLEKRRVLVIEKKGFRIALLNYTYSTNGIKVPDGLVVNLPETQT